MKKILHIITRLDMGGSAQNTLFTCLGLSEKYDMTLVHGLSLESRMTELEKQLVNTQINEAERHGVKFIPLPSLVRRIDPIQDFKAFLFLRKFIKDNQPAIVHTHSSKAGLLGRWAAWVTGTPFIIHTPHGHVFYGHFDAVTSRFFLFIEKITAKFTDRIVALTEGEKNDYIAFSVTGAERLVKIHSGVDVGRFMKVKIDNRKKKKSLGLNSDSMTVGTVGWLLAIKGPRLLLRAMDIVWRSNPEVQLVFVGKGELEDELRAESLRMGYAEKVVFLGWRDDIPEVMQLLDIFVLPSLNEGMGRVLVEAMAAGKAVVASRVGGIPDLVKHEKNGLLVEPGDVKGLAKAILRVLNDETMRLEFGKNGKTLAPHFSLKGMIEKIDNLYGSLLQEGDFNKIERRARQ